MDNDDVVDVLNDLLETSMDGALGFQNASEHTESPALREVFYARAQDCQRASDELRAQILALGGKAEEHGTAGGALHRGWINLRDKITGQHDAAMLEECERGEDVAKGRYEKALQKDLPERIRLMVQREYQGVLRNHDQIRTLRNQCAHGAI